MTEFFEITANKICDKHNIKINPEDFKSDFDVYKYLNENDISENEIIQTFAMNIGLPYADLSDKNFSSDYIKNDKIENIFNEYKIFPYIEDDVLNIAVSNPNQMEFIKNIVTTQNFAFVFSFQFVIDSKLNEFYSKYINNNEQKQEHDEYEDKEQDNISDVSVFNDDKQKIMLATGETQIDQIIQFSTLFNEQYKTISVIQNRNLLINECETHNIDILLVSDNLGGKSSLTEILLKIRFNFPKIRIIYLTGEINAQDTIKKSNLASLASVGIFDIIMKNEISTAYLKDLLDHPHSLKDVKELMDEFKDGLDTKKHEINLNIPQEVEEDTSNIYPNLFAFADAHGGNGKTFLLENIAIEIATNGIQTTKNEKPKIAILDFDFDSFNISKFFNVLSDKNNIFTVIDEIHKIIDQNTGIEKIIPDVERQRIMENIHLLFKPTSKYSNIYMIPGSSIVYQLGNRDLMDYATLTYLIESIVDNFDVILIDMNSDIENRNTYPLFSLCNNIYFIVGMNWNSFNNTAKYITYLKNKDVDLYHEHQMQFVLNKAIKNDDMYININDIEKGLDVKFNSIIPLIDSTLIFNSACKNKCIIKSSDPCLEETQYYLKRLANQIYPIKDFNKVKNKTSSETLQFLIKDNENNQKVDTKVNKKDYKKIKRKINIKKLFIKYMPELKKFIKIK